MAEVDLKTRLGLLDESEVAELRGMAIVSLRNERARGKGPAYQKIGQKTFYPLDKLRAFLAARTVVPANAPTLIHSAPRKRAGTRSKAVSRTARA